MARAVLEAVEPAPDEVIEALVATAASFGIRSLVAPLLALHAARASAALCGRNRITEDDAIVAARLVLAPRALVDPNPQQTDGENQEIENTQSPPPSEENAEREQTEPPPLEDLMRAAVQAALPPGLLETRKNGANAARTPSRRGGAGSAQASPLRGRPGGVRMGRMRPGARLALVETLRAAAPWQPVRRAETTTDFRQSASMSGARISA